MNATDGIKIQKNHLGSWVDSLSADVDGSLVLRDKIEIGQDNQIFKAEPDTGIWLGHANFDDAPFSVSNLGVLSATKINLTGGIIESSKGKFDLDNGTFRLGNSDIDYKLKFNGTDLLFGSGVLQWDNLDAEAKINLTGPQGEQGIQGPPGVDGSYYAPPYLGWTSISSTEIISPQITGGTGRFRDTIYIGADDGTYNKAGISALGNLDSSIRFWAGNVDKTLAPFRVAQDGSVTMTKFNLLSTVSDINNSYIDMYGSKIEGGKLDIKDPYYEIGTAILITGSRSGILRSRTYLNDGNTTVDYIMDITHNSIMVQGGNLVLGGVQQDRSVVITRRINSTYHDLVVPQSAALHVVGNINFTGDLYKDGNPYTIVAKFA
jgi:hypothetical protein